MLESNIKPIKQKQILSVLRELRRNEFINSWKNQPIFSFQTYGGKRNKPKKLSNPYLHNIQKNFANEFYKHKAPLVADGTDDFSQPYTVIHSRKEVKL